jgi:hypothetical protein
MLVRDLPLAIDVTQPDRQPEQEPAYLGRATERAGAAPHDSDGEGHIFAGGDCKFLNVECL